MSARDPREWRFVRIGLVAVAVLAVADALAWKVHEVRNPPPSRLDSAVRCLASEKGLQPAVPAGDPVSSIAGAGSLRVTVEGNGVIVALASSREEAATIERAYRSVGGELSGRLERRDRTVYAWDSPASPTQRQTMYDCQY